MPALAAPLLAACLAGPALGQQPEAAPAPSPPAPAAIDVPPPGGLHDGVPVEALQALHALPGKAPQPASFGTATTGWSLIVPGGVVFVYVAPSVEDAVAWTTLQLGRQRTPPAPVEQPVAGVEQAWRGGTSFYLLRDDNVGIMVQGTAEAGEEASLVRGLLRSAGEPWPPPVAPAPQPDGTWVVEDPDALHLAWVGGRRLPGPGLRFAAPPQRVVRWDALGRASVWEPAPSAP